MTNEELLEKAEHSITKLFSDMSVDQSETKENLEQLMGFIQDMINTLD